MITKKAALYERLLRQRIDGVRIAGPIPRRTGSGPAPLSFAQARLWFLAQLDPGSAAYNVHAAMRLRGPLRVPALSRALSEVVRRHEVLRTTFRVEGDEPVQVVAPPAPLPLPLVDLGGIDPARRDAELARLAAREAGRAFDLSADAPFRAALVRAGPGHHVLLLTLHHVASDGWSNEVLAREVGALYAAFAAGRPSPLPELPIQYADFAAWQRARLSGAALDGQADYWRRRLAGAPPLLSIPTDRPRPAVAGTAGARVELRLSPRVSAALAALARAESTTPFTVLLAGWQALLARWSGCADVTVGTPVAGRGSTELEGMIGMFANTLVIRGDLSGEPSARELVRRARAAVLDAQAHQDLPFERLVEALGVERSLGHAPLFQAMFVHRAPARGGGAAAPAEGGVTVEQMDAGDAPAPFDLSLATFEEGGQIGAVLTWRADLWERATAERMAAHLARVLEAFATAPDRAGVAATPPTPAEARLAAACNDTARPYPAHLRLHDLFRAQAERTPDAVALRRGEARWTYAELDARAEAVARRLRARGVGAERAVGVFSTRTPHMVAALLGVLKAGGAYLPLDPAYPPGRLAYMLEDSGARVLLAERALADRLPPSAARVLWIAGEGDEGDDIDGGDIDGEDVDGEDIDREDGASAVSAAPGAGEAAPGSLAYVIYTSGSTGRPKGVAVEHRGAVAFVHWFREAFGEEERCAVLGSTSISFDVSVAELFGTLCWGGTLVLVDDALSLATLKSVDEVRMACMVPSAAAELLRAGALPPSLRTLALAGEALPPEVARDLYASGTVRRVVNAYGPTEDTTYSTWSEIAPGAERVDIGRPISNGRAHVLDAALRPVPVGVAGELFLAGDGVARGYLGRSAPTAERFLPDPHGPPGSRMYRVGDVARRLGDGRLEYLGRTDHQVKVRGFRIEPGEIEAVLRAHPDVRDCAVLAREDAPGAARLAVYVVGGAAVEALRAHLAGAVPAYMVPTAWVRMDALPRGATGKLDRRALPAPEAEPRPLPAAPRDALELRLAAAWEEVLGVRPVGVHDDFFALGGHSLLTVRLMARVEAATGARLPLAAVFEARTVAALAARLRRGGAPPGSGPRVTIRAEGSAAPLFLVHPVGGSVVAYAGLAARLPVGFPIHALQSRGLVPGEAPAERVEAMAADYVAAVRSLGGGPCRLAGWSMGGVLAFEMTRQLEAAGEEVAGVAMIDSAPALSAEGDEVALLAGFARQLGVDPARVGVTAARARAMDPAERLARLHAAAVSTGALPADADLAAVERAFAVFAANLRALAAHRPGRVAAPAVLLRAADGTLRGDAGWGAHAPRLDVRAVPGDHFSALAEPHLEVLARTLSEVLHLEATPR